MAATLCPNCSKPCLSGASVCRSCITRLPSPDGGADVRTWPEIEAELRELNEWAGRDDADAAPALSRAALVTFVRAVAGIALGVFIPEKQIGLKMVAALADDPAAEARRPALAAK